MRRHIITGGLLLSFIIGGGTALRAQTINDVLQQVEVSNRELQARRALTAAQKLEARTGNSLYNPTVEYEQLWGNSSALGRTGELTIAQEFDFPTAYAHRRKIAQLKARQYDSEGALFRQDLLLQVKELCLEIVYLRKQNVLLQERAKLAEELSVAYQRKLEAGNTNILTVNKIEVERINMTTALTLNESALLSKLQQLNTLCGGMEVQFTTAAYDVTPPLPAYPTLEELYMEQNLALQSAADEALVGSKTLSLSRSMSLPKLEVGYRHDFASPSREQFRGFKVGMSLPLFENTNRIKAAKAMQVYNESQRGSIETTSRATLRQLYDQAKRLETALERLRTISHAMENIPLLNRALAAGEVTVIEYFTEVSTLYQSLEIQLTTERDYQITLAQINRFLL